MVHSFGHRVAMCCDMSCVAGAIVKLVKFESTTPNMSQYVATRWSNARNMLRPIMLRYVALACCHRLAAGLNDSLETCKTENKYLSNRPQVSMVYRLINHAGC